MSSVKFIADNFELSLFRQWDIEKMCNLCGIEKQDRAHRSLVEADTANTHSHIIGTHHVLQGVLHRQRITMFPSNDKKKKFSRDALK